MYSSLNAAFKSMISAESDVIANLANASALLFSTLPQINWSGFYLFKSGELVLGPFQGKLACTRIKLGRGVCGTAAQKRQTIVVEDVDAFPGHIACDSASRSEIVVPVVVRGELFGVLDVDSPVLGRFDSEDQKGLETLVETLCKAL
ncbi:GAF domain-containing protein [bacterium]|nr:GAF domain-containing protein [bacterium]